MQYHVPLTFSIFTRELSPVFGNVRSHDVVHQYAKAQLLFGTELFQYCSLVGACLEISLMARQLHPRVSLLLVGLEERGPLHNIP